MTGPVHQKGLASIIIVTYNHRQYLDACLKSIEEQESPHEIIIVDNCSQDDTVIFLRSEYPEVTLIQSPDNRGFGAANNLGVSHANGEYVVFLNPDTIVHKDWLFSLLSPLEEKDHLITTPKILNYDGLTINTCGNINHFTGLNFTRGLGQDPSHYQDTGGVSGISGACFAMTIRDFLDIGGFDEHFFLYNEDSDLSWRAHFFDYNILCVTESIARHMYHLNVTSEKLYFLEIGRYMILRKYYSLRDIFLISPSLLLAEILTWGYAIRLGKRGFTCKVTALQDGIRCEVEKFPNARKRLLPHLCVFIPEDQLTFNKLERVAKVISNKIFFLNFRLIT
ncbi:MAG: glycosyltransferase family 2 protein [Methanomicrobiales archaeon]